MKNVYGLPIVDLKILPEKMIRDAAEMFKETDPNNSFVGLLESANEFRQEGLTPVFLCDKDMKKLLVTTKEILQKKFH
jgi:PP-loop superfamily ATP-utilizing enzyme